MLNKKMKAIVCTTIIFLLCLSTIYAADPILTSKLYKIIKNSIVDIQAETSFADFVEKAEVRTNSGTDIAVTKEVDNETVVVTANNWISTGMKLTADGSEYNLIVLGDLSGDGRITALDLAKAKDTIVENDNAAEGPYWEAGDMNHDGKLTATDIARLKMLLVGEPLPNDDVEEELGNFIISKSVEELTTELDVLIEYSKPLGNKSIQVSIDGGRTYTDGIDSVTLYENTTIIARLLDEYSRVIKMELLEIDNIDNEPPKEFTPEVTITIANLIIVKGQTDGADEYYFSINDGKRWDDDDTPLDQEEKVYIYDEVEPNTELKVRMKAVDKVGNETITEAIIVRTYKEGIDILAEKLGASAVDKATERITYNGETYRLIKTQEGSYSIIAEGANSDGIVEIREQLEKGLIEQILDWKILDGETTSSSVDKVRGTYVAQNGYKYQVYIDFDNGVSGQYQIYE